MRRNWIELICKIAQAINREIRRLELRAKNQVLCIPHCGLIFFVLVLFSLSSFSLYAEKITFTADSMTGSAKNDNTNTILNGEAYILTESIEIAADRIELSGDDYRNIKANGNVSGKNFDSNMEFTCGTLEYDRKTKIALLRNDVKLVDTENSVTAQAQMIEYNSDTDIAVLQIGINLTQKDNVCSGSYAVYHKKDQMLNLSGNARIKQKDDTFRAQHITLNMDTEEITLDGRVKGTVSDKNDSNGTKDGGKASASSGANENKNASTVNVEKSDGTDTAGNSVIFGGGQNTEPLERKIQRTP